MAPNLHSGSRYLVGRPGAGSFLSSLCLSCAFLAALILILSAHPVTPFYLYTPFVTKFAVSTAVHSYNRLQDPPSVETVRLPDDAKVVHRENETRVVGNRERNDAGQGGMDGLAAAEDELQWGTGEGLSQPDNAERSRLQSVGRNKSPQAAASSTGRANISLTDLFNWKGELDGVDLRESLHNLTPQERRVWLKLNWANFKILQADSLSQQFSKRLKAFFHGQEYTGEQETRDERWRTGGGTLLWQESARTRLLVSESQPGRESVEYQEGRFQERATGRQRHCKLRFFMTWISSISSFGLREHICLESIFTYNPTACVVILSRSLDTPEGREILRPFVDRGVHILAVSPDLPFLFRDTPASEWFKRLESGGQDPGDISFSQNLSNILRMAVLYKYGGIYLDNDVLVLRDFSGLQNILGAQSVNRSTGEWTRLNNAVMIFQEKSPVVFEFIQEFALTYNGRKWGHNGPYLVTRVIRRLTGRAGYEFSVAPPAAFYPVNWSRIQSFFLAPHSQEERKSQIAKLGQLERESYAVHLWNKASRNMDVHKGSIMDILFQKVFKDWMA